MFATAMKFAARPKRLSGEDRDWLRLEKDSILSELDRGELEPKDRNRLRARVVQIKNLLAKHR